MIWVRAVTSMSEQAATKGAERWSIPAIDGSDGQGFLTAGRLQELQKDAFDEGWKKGHEEGLAAGEAEIASRAARYDELLMALSRPFDILDESVETQLVELSIALVKQLFRREVKIDPNHVIGVVRTAIDALPIASQMIQVHLNPEDATLVRESLTNIEGEPAWSIVEDPLMTKGGCKVTTRSSQIDATAESRLHAVISRCFGEGRDG